MRTIYVAKIHKLVRRTQPTVFEVTLDEGTKTLTIYDQPSRLDATFADIVNELGEAKALKVWPRIEDIVIDELNAAIEADATYLSWIKVAEDGVSAVKPRVRHEE